VCDAPFLILQSRGGSGRVNGKGAKVIAPARSRKKILSWVDTPDEVYFVADTTVRYVVLHVITGSLLGGLLGTEREGVSE